MRAFWWFKEGTIAGMARPGFNNTPWFEFPFEEAVLVGWIGQHSSGHTSMANFQQHVHEYGGKILQFYKTGEDEAKQKLLAFNDKEYLGRIFQRVTDRSHLLQSFEVTNDQLRFHFSETRLRWEIEFLKQQGIENIVSLTEQHHSKEDLRQHFDACHLSITDLDAPTVEQARQLAEVIRAARRDRKKVAVHCLAGIGRTSTMLISAHMVLGESLESLKTLVAKRNPAFVFAGKQADFITNLAKTLET